jgi:hypothetical protein
MSKEEMLKKILDAPETRDIADTLGLPVEEYAAQVLYYKMNPTVEPRLKLMDEATARAKGVPPTQELMAELMRMVEAADVMSEKSVYQGIESDDKGSSGSLRRKPEEPPLPKPKE